MQTLTNSLRYLDQYSDNNEDFSSLAFKISKYTVNTNQFMIKIKYYPQVNNPDK